MTGKRKPTSRARPTKRMLTARAALIDAATEVACVIGSSLARSIRAQMRSDGGDSIHLAEALGALYAANDEWQEAQLRGTQP